MKLKTALFLLCFSRLIFATGGPLEIIGTLPASNVMSFLSAKEQAKIVHVNKNFKQASDDITNINANKISDEVKHLLKKIESNTQKILEKKFKERKPLEKELKHEETLNCLRTSTAELISKGIMNSKSLARFISVNFQDLGVYGLDSLLFETYEDTEEAEKEVKETVKQLEHLQQQLSNAEEFNLMITSIKTAI